MGPRPVGQLLSIREMAAALGISPHFLTKTLQRLSAKGLLVSYRGPNGGVALARPADEITLLDVVEAIDGLDVVRRCVMGLPECSDEHPCSLHRYWKEIRERILEMLSGKSVGALVREMGPDAQCTVISERGSDMTEQEGVSRVLDCIGLYCPEPLFQTRQEMDKASSGKIVEVLADDPAAEEDLVRFAKRTGHEIVQIDHEDDFLRIRIRKRGHDG